MVQETKLLRSALIADDSRFVWQVKRTAITEPLVLKFVRYWEAKRSDDIPHRDRIDPVIDIPALIANIILFDVKSDGTVLYRIVGEEIVERSQRNLTGKPLEAAGVAAANALRAIQTVCIAKRKPVYYFGDYDWSNGSFTTFEGVTCPLAGMDGKVEKLIAVIAYHRRAKWMRGQYPAELP